MDTRKAKSICVPSSHLHWLCCFDLSSYSVELSHPAPFAFALCSDAIIMFAVHDVNGWEYKYIMKEEEEQGFTNKTRKSQSRMQGSEMEEMWCGTIDGVIRESFTSVAKISFRIFFSVEFPAKGLRLSEGNKIISLYRSRPFNIVVFWFLGPESKTLIE